MKTVCFKTWLLLVFLLVASQSYGQKLNPGSAVQLAPTPTTSTPTLCGTQSTHDPNFSPSDFETYLQQYQQTKLTDGSMQVQIPIQIHIVRTSSGSGGLSVPDLNSALSTLNNDFSGVNFNFVQCGPVNYIDNSSYYYFNQSVDEAPMANTHNVPNVVNIYFVLSISAFGGNPSGYAYFPWMLPADLIMMDYNVPDMDNILSHEMGHYFGLYHTHEGNTSILTQEYVNGFQCATRGDLLCDTPADPGLYLSGAMSGCQYVGFFVDPNGWFYNPDTDNLMSYAPPNCIDDFTTGQEARMSWYEQNGRGYLQCSGGGSNLPDLTFYSPPNTNVTVNGTNVQINVDVVNIGTGVAGPNKLIYFVLDPQFNIIPIDSSNVSSLSAGASQLYSSSTIDLSTFNLPPATYLPGFWIDAYNVIPEINDSASSNAGYWNSPSITISAPAPPVANFFANTTSICVGESVNFTSTSTNATSLSWSFGNGATSSQSNPTITYNSPGTYTVSLTATGAGGSDTETKTAYITVHALPSVSLPAFNSVCSTDPSFALNGSPSGGSYSGPGVSGSQFNPASAGVGTHTITYTYTDGNGCTNSATTSITVTTCAQPPVANFFANTTSICVGESVNFTSTSTNATSLSWSFGNGATSSQSNPTITYNSPGTYTVSLTATGAGGSDTETKTAYITVHALPSVSLPAFNSVCSTDPSFALNGSPSGGSYSGPGVSGSQFNPASAGVGTHTITYTYTDGNGCTNSATTSITVTTCAQPPVANFFANTTSICVGESVNFTSTSTNATSLSWSFGNGATSSQSNPTITYNSPGTYTVSLTATGAGGSDTETKTAYITVHALPSVSLPAFNSVCSTDPSFALNGSPSGGSYSGPGVSGSQFNPASAGVGTHTITYTYTDGNGCTNSATTSITVTSCAVAPVAAFTASPDTLIALNGSVDFVDQSTGTPTSWAWDFGNGTTYNGQAPPSVSYANTGTYDVSLTACNSQGCDTETKSAYIIVHPFANPASSNASAAVYGQAQIAGIPADLPDVIAGFDPNGTCVGWSPLIVNNGIAYFSLNLVGDDPNDPGDQGMNPGEDFFLKLWDADEMTVLEYESPGNVIPLSGWFNNNGAPLPSYSDPSAIFNFLLSVEDMIPLTTGWNLISLDVLPADSTPAAVFAGLNPNNLQYVTGFDATGAKVYDPNGMAIFNSLTHLRKGYGYWVKVNGPDTLYAVGDAIPASFKRDLDAGWNLFGYMPSTPEDLDVYFSSLISANNLLYVTSFDSIHGTRLYDPAVPFLASLNTLENGFGYWVKVANSVGGDQYRTTAQAGDPTPIFNFYNGQSNLSDDHIGKWVMILSQAGDTVGQMEIVTGGYLLTGVVYGDDPSTPELEGIAIGDTLSFAFEGMIAQEQAIFPGNMEVIFLDLHFIATPLDRFAPELSLKAYPNPFEDQVQIDFTLRESTELEFRLFNQLGQEVASLHSKTYSPGQQQLQWQLPELTEGVYLLTATSNGLRSASIRMIRRR